MQQRRRAHGYGWCRRKPTTRCARVRAPRDVAACGAQDSVWIGQIMADHAPPGGIVSTVLWAACRPRRPRSRAVTIMSESAPLPSDRQLVDAARSGSASAWGDLVARHRPAVLGVAREIDRRSAQERTDDAFVRLRTELLRTEESNDLPTQEFGVRALRPRALALLTGGTFSSVPPRAGTPEVAELAVMGLAFGRMSETWQTVLWHRLVELEPTASVAPLMGRTAAEVVALEAAARRGPVRRLPRGGTRYSGSRAVGVSPGRAAARGVPPRDASRRTAPARRRPSRRHRVGSRHRRWRLRCLCSTTAHPRRSRRGRPGGDRSRPHGPRGRSLSRCSRCRRGCTRGRGARCSTLGSREPAGAYRRRRRRRRCAARRGLADQEPLRRPRRRDRRSARPVDDHHDSGNCDHGSRHDAAGRDRASPESGRTRLRRGRPGNRLRPRWSGRPARARTLDPGAGLPRRDGDDRPRVVQPLGRRAIRSVRDTTLTGCVLRRVGGG